MISLVATLALFLAAGFAIEGLFPRLPGDVAGRIGTAFLAGLVACGALLFVATLAGVPFGRGLVGGVFGAAVVCAVLRRQQDGSIAVAYPRVATFVTAIPVLVLLVTSVVLPLNDYDGRAFWLLKARAITAEKSIQGDFFHGRTGYDPRNRYPLLVPLDVAAVYSIVGDDDDRNSRWLFALTGIAFLLLLRQELSRRVSPAIAAWVVAALAWTPQMLLAPEGSALSAYADVPLAAFSAAAFFALLDRKWGWFALWMSGAVLTKNEGLAIACVLCALAVVLGGRSALNRRFAGSLAGIVIAIVALVIWQQRIPPGDEHNLPVLILSLPEQIDRLPQAAWSFLRHWAAVPAWGVTWIAFAAGGILLLALRRREAWTPIAFCAILTAIYVSTYAVSPWKIEDLASTSADRLLLHMIGPAACVIALGFKEAFRRREVPGAGDVS